MTELVFEDALPPTFPEDEAPQLEDVGLSCLTCGKTLVYGGRGRKPKYCDEHKKQSGGASTRARSGSNEKLATQAADSLVQINRLTGFGARILGLPATSEAVMFCEEGFRTQAYEALLTDPALCKQILSAGQISAKFSLAIAYAMMGATVAPVAVMEIKARKAAKTESDETRT